VWLVVRSIPRKSMQPQESNRNQKPCSKLRKSDRTVRFQELDSPVLSRPMIIRGAVGLRCEAPHPAKQYLDGGDARITITLKVGAARDLIGKKKIN
jgi:hypothetical protein